VLFSPSARKTGDSIPIYSSFASESSQSRKATSFGVSSRQSGHVRAGARLWYCGYFLLLRTLFSLDLLLGPFGSDLGN